MRYILIVLAVIAVISPKPSSASIGTYMANFETFMDYLYAHYVESDSLPPRNEVIDIGANAIASHLGMEPNLDFDDVEDFRAFLIRLYAGNPDLPAPEVLVELAVETIMADLGDNYADFMVPTEFEEFRSHVSGESIVGIGAVIEETQEGDLRITGIIEGSPASQSGLLKGDVIFEVDGHRLRELDSIEDKLDLIGGEVDTTVSLVIISAGRPYEVDVVRAQVQIPTVFSADFEGVRQIQVRHFGYPTLKEIATLLPDDPESDINGIILDLRYNPGGVMPAALGTIDMFLEDGLILLSTVHGSEEKVQTSRIPEYWDGPVVVLVNGNSASAAEIVSGVLQYYDRTLVIGNPTYGKGSVQTVSTIGKAALKITTHRFLLGEDRIPVDGIGIFPNIIIGPHPTSGELQQQAFQNYTSMDPRRDIMLKIAIDSIQYQNESGYKYTGQ